MCVFFSFCFCASSLASTSKWFGSYLISLFLFVCGFQRIEISKCLEFSHVRFVTLELYMQTAKIDGDGTETKKKCVFTLFMSHKYYKIWFYLVIGAVHWFISAASNKRKKTNFKMINVIIGRRQQQIMITFVCGSFCGIS